MVSPSSPGKEPPVAQGTIRRDCDHLRAQKTRGDLGKAVAAIVLAYTPRDLQQMKGNLTGKIQSISPVYRRRLEETITGHLHGTYQRVRLMNQQGAFSSMQDPVPANARAYWEMVALHASTGDGGDHLRFLKFLLAGFCMLVEGIPGHPIGMPFPGGDKVAVVEGVYYCPVRTKANDVDAALCPFCPALQTPEIGYLKPPVKASKHRKQEYIKNIYNYHHFNG